MATGPRLSVLMPVYNEGRTLRQIVEKVLGATDLVDIELVIVDDASGDDSREIIQELAGRHSNIKYHFQERNAGKGAAVRRALAMASGEWIIIQDADLEYDPADYVRMDYGARDWDRLAAHLDSGRPAYFVNVFKREGDMLHAWGDALRRELAGRFDLEDRGEPVGRWRLELWRLQPARDKEKR